MEQVEQARARNSFPFEILKGDVISQLLLSLTAVFKITFTSESVFDIIFNLMHTAT